MTWDFVSRAEQAEYVSRAIIGRATGPIVVTGEPGIGRTTFLERVLCGADPDPDEIVLLRPPGGGAARAAALTRLDDGQRLVVVADDAHMMDEATQSVLRELALRDDVLLLLTRPLVAPYPGRPDPTGWLVHQRRAQALTLLPLSVSETAAEMARGHGGRPVPRAIAEAAHAAVGGNPARLRALVDGLPVSTSPGWEEMGPAIADSLASAAWVAWRIPAVDRADQLCRLALRYGAAEPVAPIWAMLLLLRGQADDCLEFLRSLTFPGRWPARLVIVRALALTLGSGRPDKGSEFLLTLSASGESAEFLLAFRAWLLAIAGQPAAVRTALAAIDRTDHATALFVHAARAVLAELLGQHRESVFHLRRAIAAAEVGSDDYPWIRPYLQGSLIDALMSCGRVKEAVSSAQRFHAREPSSGWPIAVWLHTLIARRALESAARS